MTDWATIASLATATGTLVLAVATFASVRSSNRTAQASERALQAGIRPVLVASRITDPPEKIGFVDDHWVKVQPGHAVTEATDRAVYLAMALRNVGPGLAVLDRWQIYPDRRPSDEAPDTSNFHRLTRDIYVAAGDLGFWQGAFRDTDEADFQWVHAAIMNNEWLTIDLLYGDHEGGQRTISRFALIPSSDGQRRCSVSRHWNLDRNNPR